MKDGRIVMVRQYRNALERETLEIPAGCRDSKTEDTAYCAAREMEEETGYRSTNVNIYYPCVRRWHFVMRRLIFL